MKNKIKVPYPFLVLLYAFFRQADLSLHRCRWTSFRKLVLYYENEMMPVTLLKYLSLYIEVEKSKNYPVSIEKLMSLGKGKFISWVFLAYKQNDCLSYEELMFCSQLLFRLQTCLNAEIMETSEIPDPNYDADKELLRRDISLFYSQILESHIYLKDRPLISNRVAFYDIHPLEKKRVSIHIFHQFYLNSSFHTLSLYQYFIRVGI